MQAVIARPEAVAIQLGKAEPGWTGLPRRTAPRSDGCNVIARPAGPWRSSLGRPSLVWLDCFVGLASSQWRGRGLAM